MLFSSILDNLIFELAKKIKNKKINDEKHVLVFTSNNKITRDYIITFFEDNKMVNITIYPYKRGLLTYLDNCNNSEYDEAEKEYINIDIDFYEKVPTILSTICRYGFKSRDFSKTCCEEIKHILFALYDRLGKRKLDLAESDYYLMNVNTIDFTYDFESLKKPIAKLLKVEFAKSPIQTEIVDEFRIIFRTKQKFTFFTSYFANLREKGKAYYMVGYGPKIEPLKEVDIVENNKIDNIWLYLLKYFNVYGLPEELVFNDYETYAKTYKTLKALNIKVSLDRYNLHQYYFRDLIYFANAYFEAATDKTNLNELNDFIKNALEALNQCLILGYDPEKELLGKNLSDFYKIIQELKENTEEKPPTTLVS